jgi:hypothetical protein
MAFWWRCQGWRPTLLALGPLLQRFILCSGRPLPVCHGVDTIDDYVSCEKRASRKAPGCRDRSRQVNKRSIGNVQYGRIKAHFLILKRHGFAHLVKCLRVSSDSLDTG